MLYTATELDKIYSPREALSASEGANPDRRKISDARDDETIQISHQVDMEFTFINGGPYARHQQMEPGK